MKQFFDFLRALPEGSRVTITFVSASLITFGIFSLWIGQTGHRFRTLSIAPPSQNKTATATPSSLFSVIKNNIAQIGGIVGGAVDKILPKKTIPPSPDSSYQVSPNTRAPEPRIQSLPLSD